MAEGTTRNTRGNFDVFQGFQLQRLCEHEPNIFSYHLLPKLHMIDVFSLAGTNAFFKDLVYRSLKVLPYIDFTGEWDKFDCSTILELVFENARTCQRLIIGDFCWRLNDEILLTFLTNSGRHLEDLDLYECRKLSSATLRAIPVHCPKLKALRLAEVKFCTPDDVLYITQHCRGLTRLDISHINNLKSLTENEMKAIAATIPNMRELIIVGHKLVGEASAIAIANNCPQLRKLNAEFTLISPDIMQKYMEPLLPHFQIEYRGYLVKSITHLH